MVLIVFIWDFVKTNIVTKIGIFCCSNTTFQLVYISSCVIMEQPLCLVVYSITFVDILRCVNISAIGRAAGYTWGYLYILTES